MLDSIFRPNPDYEMVPFDRMTAAERDLFAGLRADAACAGILRPAAGSGLRIKSLCHDTARLLEAVRGGARLPEDVSRALDGRVEPIVELLLDDVLQIYRDGRFESGPRVRDLLAGPGVAAEGAGRLARLSLDAIRHAERLPIDDPLRLSAQMYFYHRTPVTPQWLRRIGKPEAFARYLGIDGDSACGRLLRAHARRVPVAPEMAGWHVWETREGRRFDFKLYVSPTVEHLPEALRAAVEVFVREKVARFKVGGDLPGIARPDKIVAYFHEFPRLEAVAAQVAGKLAGLDAHGVPFTAELAGDGITSWGMDPHDVQAIEWGERASWRVWIASHLARSLLDARKAGDTSIVPWRFALDRLRLDGVDPATWTPTAVYRDKIQHQGTHD